MELNVDREAQIPKQTVCVSDRKQKNVVKFARGQSNLIFSIFSLRMRYCMSTKQQLLKTENKSTNIKSPQSIQII